MTKVKNGEQSKVRHSQRACACMRVRAVFSLATNPPLPTGGEMGGWRRENRKTGEMVKTGKKAGKRGKLWKIEEMGEMRGMAEIG